jgi:hypothetical protein
MSVPTCKIQWIDSEGKCTPDQNPAVAIAHAHESIWLRPAGGEDNRVVGYSNKIVESFPICRAHLGRLNPGWKGWSVGPLPAEESPKESLTEG